MEMNRIRVMVFEPGEVAHTEYVKRDVSVYSDIVGGPITAKPLDDKTVIVYNDTKVEENARPNRWVGNAIINGTFFLATDDGTEKFSSIESEQMMYYNAMHGKPQEISQKDYLAHIAWGNNVIGKDEVYVNNLNLDMGRKEPDFKAIVESLKTEDKTEAKEMLKKLHDVFVNSFGTNDVDNLIDDEEFIHLPAVCKSRDTGELHIGLVYVDLESSGEHWGTRFITGKGFIGQDDFEKDHPDYAYIKAIGNYDYWYTPIYDDDIHSSISNAPVDVLDLINYARGNEEQTQGMNMDSTESAPMV